MATNVYIDGFNLYNRLLKKSRLKWLNLREMVLTIYPNENINRVRYFTSKVHARPHDPSQPFRQETYWRALRTIPGLSIHEGMFLTYDVLRPLASDQQTGCQVTVSGGSQLPYGPTLVRVTDTKEKGSDVNLATYLLFDGFRNDCDKAIVVTSDSDLVEPIRIARDELGLVVGLLYTKRKTAPELKNAASFHRRLRINVLEASQFPDVIHTPDGDPIRKPAGW